jgi:hypothetical protein
MPVCDSLVLLSRATKCAKLVVEGCEANAEFLMIDICEFVLGPACCTQE